MHFPEWKIVQNYLIFTYYIGHKNQIIKHLFGAIGRKREARVGQSDVK